MNQITVKPIDELPEISPMPHTATKIIAACDAPNLGARELCDIMQCDPGIALKILRIANSSVYGMSGQISNLQHAVVVLGFRTIRDLAYSAAAEQLFDPDGDSQRQALWIHSLACAAIAKLISDQNGVPSEEAFLTGIMHDAGKLVLLEAYGADYDAATSGAAHEEMPEAERLAFGIDHQQLGSKCAQKWNIPHNITTAISNHHNPLETSMSVSLTDVIYVANVLVRHWGLGLPEPVEQDIERLCAETSIVAGSDLDTLFDQSAAGFESLVASFDA